MRQVTISTSWSFRTPTRRGRENTRLTCAIFMACAREVLHWLREYFASLTPGTPGTAEILICLHPFIHLHDPSLVRDAPKTEHGTGHLDFPQLFFESERNRNKQTTSSHITSYVSTAKKKTIPPVPAFFVATIGSSTTGGGWILTFKFPVLKAAWQKKPCDPWRKWLRHGSLTPANRLKGTTVP